MRLRALVRVFGGLEDALGGEDGEVRLFYAKIDVEPVCVGPMFANIDPRVRGRRGRSNSAKVEHLLKYARANNRRWVRRPPCPRWRDGRSATNARQSHVVGYDVHGSRIV